MAKVTPKKKSNTGFIVIILAVVLAGGTAIFSAVQGNKTKALELKTDAPLPAARGYLRGDPNAPITIVEFGDFECPGCGQFATVQEPDLRKRVIEAGLANFKFMDFPLVQAHQNTLTAHLAAGCADEQGKFWEMHDKLYEGQFDWNGQATSNPRKIIDEYAKGLGLDMAKYNDCFEKQRPMAQIMANQAEGTKLGINGTPTIVIGNRAYSPTPNVDEMIKILDSLKTAGAVNAPAAAAPAGDSAKK
ncbi:MAG: DsbA family protein [Gemmatimonadaceae bacterium]|nr:DsbA family protein [Gemmatimonadaceae bacterium]